MNFPQQGAARRAWIVGALAALASLGAQAQSEDWPKAGTIRIITPNAAGSVGDNLFRAIAPLIEARINQKFVIENRSGAAGNIGMQAVARAPADGYTLLLAPTANYAVNSHLFKNTAFDGSTQLDVIAVIAEAPLVAVASAEAKAKTLGELAAQLKAPNARFNYGSPGVGSPTHLAGATFSLAHNNQLVHVAYRGTPPLLTALLANDVQLAFPTYAPVREQIKAGRLVPLAVAARQRIAELPNVPTVVEAGFPNLVFSNWWALAAPRGTDRKIINRLGEEILAALNDAGAKEKIATMGHQPMNLGPQAGAEFAKAESARFKTLIERVGITAE